MHVSDSSPHNDLKSQQRGVWLTTFNDLMTLLLVFFVLLFSMSDPDIRKLSAIQEGLQSGLGVLMPGSNVAVDPNDTANDAALSSIDDQTVSVTADSVGDTSSTDRISRRQLPAVGVDPEPADSWLFKEIAQALRDEPLIQAVNTAAGVLITVENAILYPTGSADLTSEGYPLLEKVADVVGPLSYPIRVEGHTDNVPIHTARYASNWELSVARAVTVVRYFIQQGGIAPERLSAAGYGASKPLFPNKHPEDRRRNRRVEIILEIDQGR